MSEELATWWVMAASEDRRTRASSASEDLVGSSAVVVPWRTALPRYDSGRAGARRARADITMMNIDDSSVVVVFCSLSGTSEPSRLRIMLRQKRAISASLVEIHSVPKAGRASSLRNFSFWFENEIIVVRSLGPGVGNLSGSDGG